MELVRNFLENEGLQSVLCELDAVSKADFIEDSLDGVRMDIEDTSTKTNKFKNTVGLEEMITIHKYISEYLRLRHWVMASLDHIKRELFTLSYPIFELIYIAMIRCDAFHDASEFMINWGEDYRSNESTKEDIVTLASISSTNDMKSRSFDMGNNREKRDKRIQIKVKSWAHGLFMRFLNENNMFLILGVIYDEVQYLVDDSVSNLQKISTNTFANKLRLNNWSGNHAGGNENIHNEVSGKIISKILTPAVFQKGSTSGDSSSYSIFRSELFEKSSKREQIRVQCDKILNSPSSIIWPTSNGLENGLCSKQCEGSHFSLLCTTITNTYDNVSCMDIGGPSGSQNVCGFQDGCIRIWPRDIVNFHSQHSLSFPDCKDYRDFRFVSPRSEENQLNSNGVGTVQRSSVSGRSQKNGTFNSTKFFELRGHERPVYSICQDALGRYILSSSGDSTVRLWNMVNLRCMMRYRTLSPSWNIDMSPSGHYFAVSNQNCTASLYGYEYDTPLRIFVGHMSDVNSCKFHPNESYLVTGGEDCTARLWDLRSGASSQICYDAPAPVSVVAICSNGKFLAFGCKNGSIMLYDIFAGKRIALYDGHSGCVNSLCFSPVGDHICSGGDDCSVRLWNMRTAPFHGDDVNISSDNHMFHTKFSSVFSTQFVKDNLIYAGGVFSLSDLRKEDNYFKHDVEGDGDIADLSLGRDRNCESTIF